MPRTNGFTICTRYKIDSFSRVIKDYQITGDEIIQVNIKNMVARQQYESSFIRVVFIEKNFYIVNIKARVNKCSQGFHQT